MSFSQSFHRGKPVFRDEGHVLRLYFDQQNACWRTRRVRRR